MVQQNPGILTSIERFVKEALTEKLSKDHHYHNLPHTLAVRNACLEMAERFRLSQADKEVLEIACLFHDTGFTEVYEGHEGVSHRIARAFLTQYDYPEAQLEKVLACIDATFPPHRPRNLLEKIIRDADMINLGSEGYPESLTALRHEWSVFMDQQFKNSDWFKYNYDFVSKHRYHTEIAEEMYGARKALNLEYLKRMAKKTKQQEKKTASKLGDTIQSNRSAQMMFKTALRNHLDLSTLADNKANIMLSVNALILTIAAPMAMSYIRDNIVLIIPLICLLATCLISMVFATLATRPIKMTGSTTREAIEEGTSNLFFFGNFYRMSIEDYQSGVRSVVADEEKLENAIQRDLFFLGRSLGNKYKQLRICYNVFMVGMIFTIIVLVVVYTAFIQGAM